MFTCMCKIGCKRLGLFFRLGALSFHYYYYYYMSIAVDWALKKLYLSMYLKAGHVESENLQVPTVLVC